MLLEVTCSTVRVLLNRHANALGRNAPGDYIKILPTYYSVCAMLTCIMYPPFHYYLYIILQQTSNAPVSFHSIMDLKSVNISRLCIINKVILESVVLKVLEKTPGNTMGLTLPGGAMTALCKAVFHSGLQFTLSHNKNFFFFFDYCTT